MVEMQEDLTVQAIDEAIEKDRLEIVALQLQVAKGRLEQLTCIREESRKLSDDTIRAKRDERQSFRFPPHSSRGAI
ncbi:MAG: hypothetical protein JWM99_4666 [Verrucomicrobiales bacterium]|nr:hypothetical protein [Verrucomicrobiales bacterium]